MEAFCSFIRFSFLELPTPHARRGFPVTGPTGFPVSGLPVDSSFPIGVVFGFLTPSRFWLSGCLSLPTGFPGLLPPVGPNFPLLWIPAFPRVFRSHASGKSRLKSQLKSSQNPQARTPSQNLVRMHFSESRGAAFFGKPRTRRL